MGHAETVEKILKWLESFLVAFRSSLSRREDPSTVSGKRVCDAGCGTGNLSIPLASRGADVHGSDISSAMVGEAEVRAQATLPAEQQPKLLGKAHSDFNRLGPRFSTSDLEASIDFKASDLGVVRSCSFKSI